MSSLRRLQREVVRNKCYNANGNTKAFKDEWEKIHYNSDDNVSSVKSKKVEKPKQRHYDNGKAYLKYFKAMKSFISNMQNKNQNKTNMNAKAKVC